MEIVDRHMSFVLKKRVGILSIEILMRQVYPIAIHKAGYQQVSGLVDLLV